LALILVLVFFAVPLDWTLIIRIEADLAARVSTSTSSFITVPAGPCGR
jgi:hypothetical protein